MATVNLRKRDCEEGGLPPYCIVCGEATNEYEPVPRKFLYYPPWIWFTVVLCWLLVLILFLALKRTRTVWTPLCEDHRNYWTIRKVTVIIFSCSIVGGYTSLVALSASRIDAWVKTVTVVGSIVSIILFAVFLLRSVRVTRIDDESIRITNVHERFHQEWRDQLLDDQ